MFEDDVVRQYGSVDLRVTDKSRILREQSQYVHTSLKVCTPIFMINICLAVCYILFGLFLACKIPVNEIKRFFVN